MMISPECYYELNLKGRSEEEILAQIRSLKRKIAFLKRTMEHPNYRDRQVVVAPDEEVQLACNRLYLERAKRAYTEVGGVCSPSRAERHASEVRERIPSICKIKFFIGGFFGGRIARELCLDGDSFRVYEGYSANSTSRLEVCLPIGKRELIEGIKDLHIEEWRKSYSPLRFNIVVLDGEQWSLEIYFEGEKEPLCFGGSNAYPYNFDSLLDLLMVERD